MNKLNIFITTLAALVGCAALLFSASPWHASATVSIMFAAVALIWFMGASDEYVPAPRPDYAGLWCVSWRERDDPSGSSRCMKFESLFEAAVQWYKLRLRMYTFKDITSCGCVSTEDGLAYFALYPQKSEEDQLFWESAEAQAKAEMSELIEN